MPPRRGGRGRGRGSPQKRNIPTRSDFVVDKWEQNNTVPEAQEFEEFKCDAMKTVQNETRPVESEPKPEVTSIKVEPENENFENETQNQNENSNVNVNVNENALENLSANVNVKAEVEKSINDESQDSVTTKNEEIMETGEKTNEDASKAGSDLPFKVKVSHLPAAYVLSEFQRYLSNTFNMKMEKIISPAKNSPWLLLPFATKEEQENCIKLLHNHIWKKKALRAITFYSNSSLKHPLEDEEDPESKKQKLDEVPVLSLEEEILSESLPLYNVPYEEQNRLTIQDVQLLSNKLHAFMCVRNPALAGWAEAMTEKNDGCIFKIEPLKPSILLEGYRNKCKFRIGKNTEGETTVGFCLNDNENKILGVQPGDKLIHLPDSMKYAAKKFEEFIRASGKEPYDKKQRCGFWHHIIIRIAPEGSLMLVIVTFHNNLPDEGIAEIKNQVREFFVTGDGKDCKLYSLYFQVMSNKAPMMPPEKLELLHGESHFYENICGLKFYAGPFSILNVNSSSSENIYKSIAELADPTKETTILDLCSGTGGIAFTIADKCKKVIAIESQEDHINDAMKTKEMNNIENVEFIKGKVEDVLADVFEKLGDDAPVIPIIDPPRQGLVQKAISQLRARESIQKLVYVCSNSKMGAKNFLDLCASADKKEGTFGNPLNVVFAGLPFLPIRAIPVDVAPYTVNNTIIILFERVDPSTFPPAKQPPPQPLKRPQAKPDDKKRKRNQGRRMRGMMTTRGRKFRPPGPGMKGNFKGPNFRKNGGPPRGGFHQRFPEPLMRPLDPALSLVAKYERRIAELEQQDRAFKAGLTMGLQALNTRGGPGGGGANFENLGSNLGNNFGNYRNPVIGDNPAWQRGGGRNFESPGMSFVGGNNFGGFMGGGGLNSFNSGGGFSGFSGSGNFNSSFRGGGGGGGSGKGRNFRGGHGNRSRR